MPFNFNPFHSLYGLKIGVKHTIDFFVLLKMLIGLKKNAHFSVDFRQKTTCTKKSKTTVASSFKEVKALRIAVFAKTVHTNRHSCGLLDFLKF